MGTALLIRDDQTAEALRHQARHEPNRRAALRMLGIANALEGAVNLLTEDREGWNAAGPTRPPRHW